MRGGNYTYSMAIHYSLVFLLIEINLQKSRKYLDKAKHAHAQKQTQIAAYTRNQRYNVPFGKVLRYCIRKGVIIDVNFYNALSRSFRVNWHCFKVRG